MLWLQEEHLKLYQRKWKEPSASRDLSMGSSFVLCRSLVSCKNIHTQTFLLVKCSMLIKIEVLLTHWIKLHAFMFYKLFISDLNETRKKLNGSFFLCRLNAILLGIRYDRSHGESTNFLWKKLLNPKCYLQKLIIPRNLCLTTNLKFFQSVNSLIEINHSSEGESFTRFTTYEQIEILVYSFSLF